MQGESSCTSARRERRLLRGLDVHQVGTCLADAKFSKSLTPRSHASWYATYYEALHSSALDAHVCRPDTMNSILCRLGGPALDGTPLEGGGPNPSQGLQKGQAGGHDSKAGGRGGIQGMANTFGPGHPEPLLFDVASDFKV
eukprot:895248-Pelagomonas_calceolata.AAC.1